MKTRWKCDNLTSRRQFNPHPGVIVFKASDQLATQNDRDDIILLHAAEINADLILECYSNKVQMMTPSRFRSTDDDHATDDGLLNYDQRIRSLTLCKNGSRIGFAFRGTKLSAKSTRIEAPQAPRIYGG